MQYSGLLLKKTWTMLYETLKSYNPSLLVLTIYIEPPYRAAFGTGETSGELGLGEGDEDLL